MNPRYKTNQKGGIAAILLTGLVIAVIIFLISLYKD
jgi:hypothetical protein